MDCFLKVLFFVKTRCISHTIPLLQPLFFGCPRHLNSAPISCPIPMLQPYLLATQDISTKPLSVIILCHNHTHTKTHTSLSKLLVTPQNPLNQSNLGYTHINAYHFSYTSLFRPPVLSFSPFVSSLALTSHIFPTFSKPYVWSTTRRSFPQSVMRY